MKLNLATLTIALSIALSMPTALAQHNMDNMKGMEQMKDMKDMKNMERAAENSATTHSGTGIVTRIQTEAGIVVLKHEPIASLNWPVMTMGFYVDDMSMLDNLEPGKKVEFEFIEKGSNYVITSIK